MSVPPKSVLPTPSGPGDGDGVTTFIDALLADQRRLTAVERFSQRHGTPTGPALEAHYRDLIPLTAPRPGEQYAFEVDLDRCSGCKGCVTACHSLNGLDEDESWRSVGFLVGERIVPPGSRRGEETPSPDLGMGTRNRGTEESLLIPSPTSRFGNRVIPLQQTVTTACHHCVDPACLNGCPVLAYDKDPVTGIVRHLDDQCIGCSYCILKCPYEVPQYSASRGIVRKCDMCHGRLAEGEAPACVQACPNEAIQITLVRPQDLRTRFRESVGSSEAERTSWLPDAPDPAISIPTTQYRTRHPEASLHASDHGQPRPASLHGPLVLMLVLTQAGLGGIVASATRPGEASGLVAALGSFALLAAGLVASVFHLGQPLKAWRIWLGWRTSWLSREAMVLGAASGVAGLAVVWLGLLSPALPRAALDATAAVRSWLEGVPLGLLPGVLLLVSILAVATQTMVYADTGRVFWCVRSTAPRFVGTTVLLGLAVVWTLHPVAWAGVWVAGTTALKLAIEIAVLKHADTDEDRWTALRRTAVLQCGPLRPWLALRVLLGLTGGMVIPYLIATGTVPAPWAVASVPVLLLAELIERILFFTSVSPDKMPGLPR